MRNGLLALGVMALGLVAPGLASPAAALEIEEHVRFGPPDAARTLRILSTGDASQFAPIVEGFLADQAAVAVDYFVASSTDVHAAVAAGGANMDVVMSSAMDLQLQLVNDGHARAHRSAAVDALPDWARWRDHLFAFSEEPAAIVVSRAAFADRPIPRTRQALIEALRADPGRFSGRVGTYDVRSSGLGYLFATQDARNSESYWRLAEVMGALDVALYCCSGQMIDDVAHGRLAVAYNVLGSYADRGDDRIAVILPEDFTTVMMRTALIPRDAPRPDLAGLFVDHVLTRSDGGPFGFDGLSGPDAASLRRIRLDPGLMVFLDAHKRRAFLDAWGGAVLQ